MVEKIRYIAENNGISKVYTKLAEECSEYAAARLKSLAGEGDAMKRREELADVILLIEQLNMLMPEEEKELIRIIMEQKADRQINRIKEENHGSKGD